MARSGLFDGLIFDWSFADFNTAITGPLVIGALIFTFDDHDFSSELLVLAPTLGLSGPFLSFEDFSVIDVDYGSVALAPVPLPATIWLMLAVLGVLFSKTIKPNSFTPAPFLRKA